MARAARPCHRRAGDLRRAVVYAYFRQPGARPPLSTALAVTAIVFVLDAVVVAGLVLRSADMFLSIAGTWLPFALILLATWATGIDPGDAAGTADRANLV